MSKTMTVSEVANTIQDGMDAGDYPMAIARRLLDVSITSDPRPDWNKLAVWEIDKWIEENREYGEQILHICETRERAVKAANLIADRKGLAK